MLDQMTLNSCQYHLHATLGNPSNNQSLCLMTIFEITQHHPTQNGTCREIWTLLFLFFIIIIIFLIIPQNTRNFYQLKNNLLPLWRLLNCFFFVITFCIHFQVLPPSFQILSFLCQDNDVFWLQKVAANIKLD